MNKTRKPRKKCPHCGKQRYLDHPASCSERPDPEGAILEQGGDAADAILATRKIAAARDPLPPIAESAYPAGATFLPAVELQRPIPTLESVSDVDLMKRGGLPETRGIEGWPLAKGRLSASSVAMFQRCPELFRRTYIKAEYGPASGPLVAGKAAHHLVEVAARYQQREREPLPQQLLGEVYTQGWEQMGAEREGADWGRDSEMDWLARGHTAGRAYVERVLPLLQVEQAELLFAVDVPGVPVPLVGFIDLVVPQGNIDIKFGGRYQSKIQPHWRIQGHLYMLANMRGMGWHSVNWEGEYRSPMDSQLSLPISARNYTISTQLVKNTVDAILAYAERFGVDRAWPGAISHTFACSFCHWKSHGCEWWMPSVSTL